MSDDFYPALGHHHQMDRIGPKRAVRHYVKEWRQHFRLSQDALANRVDTTKPTISKLELGHREMTLGWMGAIADALGIEPEQLLHSPEKPTPNELLRGVAPELSGATPEQASAIIEFARYTLRRNGTA